MQVTFDVEFVLDSGGLRTARLDFDLPFAPTTEIEFEHPVWHQAHRPVSVSFNLETARFFVTFKHEVVRSKEDLPHRLEAYKSHGWTII